MSEIWGKKHFRGPTDSLQGDYEIYMGYYKTPRGKVSRFTGSLFFPTLLFFSLIFFSLIFSLLTSIDWKKKWTEKKLDDAQLPPKKKWAWGQIWKPGLKHKFWGEGEEVPIHFFLCSFFPPNRETVICEQYLGDVYFLYR